MAGKSSKSGNWSSTPTTRYKVSGKNREFYTSENAPGLNPYATGGTVVDAGDGYVYHIFVSDGTFTVTSPPALIDSAEYMIVAGGGSAGSAGGGGGGGGFVFGSSTVSNAPGAYPIVIGAAGATTPGAASVRNGSPSTAFGLTATGGGGGAAPPGPAAGGNGGSGGGGVASPTISGSSGLGNTPALIPRQGYDGGLATAPLGTGSGGGAGGFGGQPGALAIGPGRIAPEFPSTVIRQGIPAPVLPAWEPLIGPAGYAAGGYGTGSPAPLIARTNPANSGYGGNGPPGSAGGGSGIVCVRYVKFSSARATGGTIEPNTDPNHPGVWRHIFTSPGTFTVSDPTLSYIDYLAIGGGGAGNGTPPSISPPLGGFTGGGGGAGGFVTSVESPDTSAYDPSESHAWNSGYSVRTGERMPVSAQPYPVTVGAGGPSPGSSGSNTTIGSPGPTQIIAYGGGAGASGGPPTPAVRTGNPGASGGGGAKSSTPSGDSAPGGSASPQGPITSAGTQGNPGGSCTFGPSASGGAGGGAGSGPPGGPLIGGTGWYSVISPPTYGTPGPVAGRRYFAGGGGGTGPGAGAGGSGGGGSGAPSTPRSGATNTGGGGGAGAPSLANAAGSGGPGIVIIQYPE